MSSQKIGFVILNFLTCNDTVELISSLITQSDIQNFDVTLYVVDNQSDPERYPGLISRTKPLHDKIKYLSSRENLGFASGMNLGIAKAREDHCDFIVCSNNDVLIEKCDLFRQMVSTYEGNRDIAVIGPSIMNRAGVQDNPYIRNRGLGHPRTRLKFRLLYAHFSGMVLFYSIAFAKLILQHLGLFNVRSKHSIPDSGLVYAVHGSFFVLTPSYFEHYEDLDRGTFLFFEEYIMAERVHREGMRQFCNFSMKVLHKEDSSTNELLGKSDVRKFFFTLKHNYISGRYFYDRYLRS